MLLVLLLAAGLWGVGRLAGVPRQARWLMIGLLYLAVLGMHVVLPEGNSLRAATGGSAALWLLLGGAAALVLVYRMGLRQLRARARSGPDDMAEPDQTPRSGRFSETELDRYSRHIVLREIGGPGQTRLRNARVLVVGAGGLGSPALLYLAAAGVGTIGVIDDDAVDNSNLQRQVIHRDASIGMPKVFSAQQAMADLNPFVTVRPYHRRLDDTVALELARDYDVILDGSDSTDTRYTVNAAAVAARVPLVSGALSQWEGQISVFDPAFSGPCYRCVFPNAPAPGLAPSCAEGGVLGPLPGVIGAMMAVETVKLLAGAGQPLLGEMLIYDALWGETRKITVKRDPACPVCGDRGATTAQQPLETGDGKT
ncbi:MAG: molybdopterin-synthase adenylyltransferase MoeB [Celeribacter sp.]|jgi:molybdopterin/thiamine biosynthesis adenylyltransferase